MAMWMTKRAAARAGGKGSPGAERAEGYRGAHKRALLGCLLLSWLLFPVTALADAPAAMVGLGRLAGRGVILHLQHTGETLTMLTAPPAGWKKGTGSVGIATLGADMDWERLADARGVSTHIVLASGYGSPTSRKFGDFLTPSQATYGGTGNVVIHLVSAYVERAMLYDRVNIAAGRMTFLSDFSANPLYCNFMNAAFCGNPRAASDNTAHAAFPTASWAARIRVQLLEALILQSGVYFTQTRHQYALSQMRSGFKFNGATIDGEAIPLELAWAPRLGRGGKLPGHYKIGFVWDTASHDSLFEDREGKLIAVTGAPPRRFHGAWSAWFLIDQRLMRFPGHGPDAGITFLGVAYFNTPRSQLRQAQYSAGLVVLGAFSGRPLDSFAINIAYTRIATPLRRAQKRLRRIAANAGPADAWPKPVTGSPRSDAAIVEAFYQFHLMRGVSIAPDLQFYLYPDGRKSLGKQLMMGVKTHVEFI
ncbi:carbohydrate porin [Swaminathania salitolerans]|nr:carbohydrate porin [Swaminathania salitolerans]GBQ10067.1 carbohydrate-selective porin B [Swaminathania salitolerans LMG 21291]